MTLEDVYEKLEQNDRLELEKKNGVIFVESDEFGVVPASDSKPTQIQVTYLTEDAFSVQPLDTGGGMTAISGGQAVDLVEGFLEGNELLA